MTDLNHVVLIGRLTQDLGSDERSFGYVGNGQARANVSIAVNRSKKNGDQWVEEVNFFNPLVAVFLASVDSNAHICSGLSVSNITETSFIRTKVLCETTNKYYMI